MLRYLTINSSGRIEGGDCSHPFDAIKESSSNEGDIFQDGVYQQSWSGSELFVSPELEGLTIGEYTVKFS